MLAASYREHEGVGLLRSCAHAQSKKELATCRVTPTLFCRRRMKLILAVAVLVIACASIVVGQQDYKCSE